MAKKEKIPVPPEVVAAKKLKRKKGWARFFAIVLAVAITGGVYVIGSKDGPKKVTEEEPAPVVVTQVVQPVVQPTQAPVVVPTTPPTTTTKPAPTTTAAPATTAAPTTTKAADSGEGGGILDTIMGLLGGFDPSSITDTLGGLVDTNSAADTIEGAGESAKDFFYGLADSADENGLDGVVDNIKDKIGGLGGSGDAGDSGESGDAGSGLGGFDLGSLGDTLGGLGDSLGGIGDMLGGLLG